jgi:hypothetical protein
MRRTLAMALFTLALDVQARVVRLDVATRSDLPTGGGRRRIRRSRDTATAAIGNGDRRVARRRLLRETSRTSTRRTLQRPATQMTS